MTRLQRELLAKVSSNVRRWAEAGGGREVPRPRGFRRSPKGSYKDAVYVGDKYVLKFGRFALDEARRYDKMDSVQKRYVPVTVLLADNVVVQEKGKTFYELYGECSCIVCIRDYVPSHNPAILKLWHRIVERLERAGRDDLHVCNVALVRKTWRTIDFGPETIGAIYYE